jgi:NADH-quinone oxidoreductase subunit A
MVFVSSQHCETNMSDAVTSSLGIVAYLALFASIGILFLLVNLLVGRLVRSQDPNDEKLEIYECGEPAVGSSFVQFDLRFYVVALLFIIFDVEVAFFFPWATLFGKATHLAAGGPQNQVVQRIDGQIELTAQSRGLYREMGITAPTAPAQIPASLRGSISDSEEPLQRSAQVIKQGAHQLALITIVDIAVFFAVLLIGFAYVWKRGDLDWVRAFSGGRAAEEPPSTNRREVDLEEALSA